MRRSVVALVLAAAVMAAGCSTAAKPATGGRHPAGPGPAARQAAANCPVTRPMPEVAVPAGAVADVLPVPYGWYGTAALRAGVPASGVLPAMRTALWPGEWGTKYPWWRTIRGTLTITARRLDGPSAGFHSQVAYGYGRSGFVPSGLIWPHPGCWRVTGTVSGHSLTIVMDVRAVGG